MILLVDDERSVRTALRKLFERGGMTVSEAGSGGEALTHLGNGDVDAVVCDILMPEVNGLEFYDTLVTRSPHLKDRVVFLTGAANDPIVHGPIEERGVPLVSKLDDLQLVVDAVRIALLRKG